MSRILSIDYGTKRVGVAVTDNLQLIATALEMVETKNIVAFLKAYLQKEEVEAFVLGLPKNLDNHDTDSTAAVLRFKTQLESLFPDKKIHLIDERFSSKIAVQTMVAGGMKKKDRQVKGNVDKISAVILLQSFMESKGF
jgi:putative holliday junction resolvase